MYAPCSKINGRSDYETGSLATNPRKTDVLFGRWSLEVIGVKIKRPQWTSERLKEWENKTIMQVRESKAKIRKTRRGAKRLTG
jgi:hypothetical protein